MEKPILYIIIPCYNEQSVLPITAPIFRDKLLSLIDKDRISPESKILFIDDGSNDSTWKIIRLITSSFLLHRYPAKPKSRPSKRSFGWINGSKKLLRYYNFYRLWWARWYQCYGWNGRGFSKRLSNSLWSSK